MRRRINQHHWIPRYSQRPSIRTRLALRDTILANTYDYSHSHTRTHTPINALWKDISNRVCVSKICMGVARVDWQDSVGSIRHQALWCIYFHSRDQYLPMHHVAKFERYYCIDVSLQNCGEQNVKTYIIHVQNSENKMQKKMESIQNIPNVLKTSSTVWFVRLYFFDVYLGGNVLSM